MSDIPLFARATAKHLLLKLSPKVYTDGIQKVVEALVAFKPF